MRPICAAALLLVIALVPAPIGAWGMDVHRYLTKRAIEGLPAEIKPFFAEKQAFITEHAADPDLWRIVGLKGAMGDEDPNHFLDIDALDEPAPFTGVPRTWTAYVARYGADRATRMGRLPWRAEEVDDLLVKAFRAIGTGTAPYAADNARYLAAVISHYVEDAHQPFHAVANYDGQLTNQRGIHSRFETELVLRNLSALKLAPVTIQSIPNVRDFIFDTLVTSQALAGGVLDADRKATTGREYYDDGYYAALLGAARPILERRLSESSSGAASAIVSAWTRAGKPPLPPTTPRTPARIPR
jgi:hypothetical protein